MGASRVEIHIASRQKVQREPSLLSCPVLILPFFIYLMYDRICVYAHSNMCGDQRATSIVFPQEHCPPYFETGALGDLELTN